MKPFVVIMGVSGCGKTTVASLLADRIPNATFLEGDSFHPPANKEKMGAGIPLTDEDRWPWYEVLNAAAHEAIASGSTPVLACSTLKESYRKVLSRGFDAFRLVFLEGSFDLIKARMDERDHEYMTSTLLESQFETLEEPEAGETVLTVSIGKSPEEIVEAVLSWLEETT
ncbi:MAG: gluconokinase [Verrucomicrobiales bacterium]|nr:gluconokinase [Verrucomicrobiales bacterium]